MIRQYNGYKPEKITSSEPLPTGGYVLTIMKASVEPTSQGGSMLVLSFDIAEGERAGWFTNMWRSDTREGKKWKGVYRLFIPTGDGSDKDGYAIRNFNNFVACLEESNPGYHWDWNEDGIKNLKLGGIWRNKEYEIEGRTGWTTEMGAVATVNDIRNNAFKPLKDKPLAKKPAAAANPWGAANSFKELPDNDADFPF